MGGLFAAGLTFRLLSSPSLMSSEVAFILMNALTSAVYAPMIPALLEAVRDGGPKVVSFALGLNQMVCSCGEMLGPVVMTWGHDRYGLQGISGTLGVVLCGYAICHMACWLDWTPKCHRADAAADQAPSVGDALGEGR